jgi:hypothetical protein
MIIGTVALICEIIFTFNTDKNCVSRINAMDDNGYGRLIHDDHRYPNARTEQIEVNGKIFPFFKARRLINIGEEITYNYGPGQYFWRAKGIVF